MEWIKTTDRLPEIGENVLAVTLYYDMNKTPIREMLFCSMDEEGELNHYGELLDQFEEVVELWIPLVDVLKVLPIIPMAPPMTPRPLTEK